MNFFTRFKKIFIIIIFLVLIGLIGFLIYRTFFKTTIVSPVASSTPGIINGLPTAGTGTNNFTDSNGVGNLPGGQDQTNQAGSDGKSDLALGGVTNIKTVTTVGTVNPTLNSNGSVQYYNKDDGRFYSLDKNGKAVLMSDKVFYNVDKVVWAPAKDRAILEYPDGNKILYNFNKEEQVTLPAHWTDFSFSPDSNQIVSKSLGVDPENRWLMVSNGDGSQAKALESIGTKDKTVYPAWSPNNQIVATYTKGVDFNRQEIYFVGLNGENFKSTMIEGRGLQSQWSTQGDRLLYSVYNSGDNYLPRLWIVNAQGETINTGRTDLNLATWSSKCTFASNTEVYCAVPENLENGAGLYPELADRTKDNLYKIDLITGVKKLIAVPDGTYNISQIMVPENQDTLYFTDKKTDQIYSVQLK
ncbi:MAG: TolB family protein [Patescibacteria group bacterium]